MYFIEKLVKHKRGRAKQTSAEVYRSLTLVASKNLLRAESAAAYQYGLHCPSHKEVESLHRNG